jgi:helix-turn-helix protein
MIFTITSIVNNISGGNIMREVPFSIPVLEVVRIDGDQVVIIVNRAETNISISEIISVKRTGLEPGKTTYDVILEAAREVIRQKVFNRFSAPELYSVAKEKYPLLKRNSFMSRVIACTPDHRSYKHYASTRDYFSHLGQGLYRLNEKYMPDKTSDEDILQDQRNLSSEP